MVVLARTTAGVVEVGTGFYFSCALLDDGTVKCWGTNSFGQLATGDLVSRTTPTRVAGLTDVRQISVGFYHVCAVKSDSTLWCWGYNGYGELGTGNTTDSSTPMQVPNVTADSVSAGWLHTCITRAGNVYCWGDNSKGQLGNGSTVSSLTPVQAIEITTATSVTADGFHSCAAIRDGLACWGDNSSGQIGEADLNAIFSTPQPTLNVAVVSVDAGDSHTCVVFSGSDIQCWGSNSSGQLGDGTTTNRIAPIRVSGLPGAATIPRVEASLSATCAAWSDGDAKCWGRNNRGQLGDGTTTDRHAPVTVTDMYGAAQISPGNTSTCGVTQSAAVSCWGANDKGQIGDGSVSYSGGPAQPYAIIESLQVSAGYHHTCAQLPGGALRCWGEGGSGELGNGATVGSLVPVNVTGSPKATAIAAGMSSTCASNIGERLVCWGDNSYGQLGSGTDPAVLPRSPDPLVVPGIGAVVSAVLGGGHGCLLRSNDELKCWGSNARGQVGDGTTTRRDWPEDILQSVATASAGYSHTCAVNMAGSVWCWGDGAFGALGSTIPSPFYRTTPIQVPGISGATAVSAGKFVSCALLVDGTVKCWGLNVVGQLGNPAVVGTSSASPVTVSLPSRAVALTSGEEGSCAVLTGGDVFCWGSNSNGQLGRNPSILKWSATPLKVEGIAKAVHISGTRGHICATLAGGGLKCWGANSYGQLGNKSQGASYVPVWVQGFAE